MCRALTSARVVDVVGINAYQHSALGNQQFGCVRSNKWMSAVTVSFGPPAYVPAGVKQDCFAFYVVI